MLEEKILDLDKLDGYEQVLGALSMFRMYFPEMNQYLINCKTLQELKEELTKIDKQVILNSLGFHKEIADKLNQKCYEDVGSKLECDLETPNGIFNYFKSVSWVKGLMLQRIADEVFSNDGGMMQ